MPERDAFDLIQTLNYANYLITKMERETAPRWERIHKGTLWCVFPDDYVPFRGLKVNPEDPTTYRRLAVNFHSGDHKFMTDPEIAQERALWEANGGAK